MTRIECFDGVNHELKRCSLATQTLSFVRIIPDTWLGQLELYLSKAILLMRKVKDTPEVRLYGRGYLSVDL